VTHSFRSRLGTATVVAIVAVLVTAGIAVATDGGSTSTTIPDLSGVIHGCFKKGGGVLRVIDPSKGARCHNNEQPLTFNERGQSGAQGQSGGAGSVGPSGLGGGASGAGGATGPKGDTGAQGLTGPKGDTGAPGIQGAPGTNGTNGTLSSAYLDAYDNTLQIVGVGADVPFDTQTETPVGITANAANTTFTVTNAGTYLVTVALGAGSNLLVKPLVNGSGGGPFLGEQCPNGASCGFSRVLSATAGDTITLENAVSGAAATRGSGITIIRIA
jgi:hypothetical protein